ncbi:EmrB/QacA subfamily drug resistance transporter [Paenibacillus cellulosilyticus]|uniref:EmrB/QacA subfamily drug resistance transporter n=1 Tax=Paenibacillus cellulosilyticus TaxID=375489 RepID=A0A2V2YXJ5_9BACL|nr:MDR family MFS transporter [Paenibacillus cellulosilyticus]PWW06548.1 EmrB/QacA subfamily drug resistance transporter [Paenibacillus cellulosilyticus]QKS46116.1 MFS transporter [Paenibacillus cellulosilyticus]
MTQDITAHTRFRTLTTAALLLAMLLASLDQVIIATSIPQIAADLGDLQHYAWVFSAYMIAELLGMPIFGKLSDMYGRKPFILAAIVMFIIGSILCGIAQSMPALIMCRVLQGLGAGAIMPISFAIVFEIYPQKLRNRMQSVMSAVYAISSVMGPIIGAVLTDYLNWRWIFYVNLPLGLVSLLLLKFYREMKVQEEKPVIDWPGLLLLFASIVSLLLLFELSGKTFSWYSWQMIALGTAAIAALLTFIRVELRRRHPFLPIELFRGRMFAICQTIGFFQGMVMMAAFTFIPLFIQTVNGGTATETGSMIMPLSISIVVSSFLGGKLVSMVSFRNALLISNGLIVISLLLFGRMDATTPDWRVGMDMVLLGLGIGLSFPVIYNVSLSRINPSQWGTVNALIPFFRSVGGIMGVSLLGSIQYRDFRRGLEQLPDTIDLSVDMTDASSLLRHIGEQGQAATAEVWHIAAEALMRSIGHVFDWSVVLALVPLLAGLWIGSSKLLPAPEIPPELAGLPPEELLKLLHQREA